jgi:hypothetical protein
MFLPEKFPQPPPVLVIVEKTVLLPLLPLSVLVIAPAPPAPIVTVKSVANAGVKTDSALDKRPEDSPITLER